MIGISNDTFRYNVWIWMTCQYYDYHLGFVIAEILSLLDSVYHFANETG